MEPVIFVDSKRVKRFFWNLSANVGVRSANQRDDVQLVQFGYFAFANNSKFPPPPALKDIFGAVKPGAEYSGKEDDPLTRAIRAHEKARGGPQDGHVSAMKSLSYDGIHSYILVALNNNLVDLLPDDFPRLDRHNACPSRVKEAVLRHCKPAT
jgi:hypothetical protein